MTTPFVPGTHSPGPQFPAFTVSWDDLFPARITSSTSSGGQWRYAWTEQIRDNTTGEYGDLSGGRAGTTSANYAIEDNNLEIDTAGEPLVWMKVSGAVSGNPVFNFNGASAAIDSGGVITPGTYATPTQDGIVSHTTQSFGGAKTFKDDGGAGGGTFEVNVEADFVQQNYVEVRDTYPLVADLGDLSTDTYYDRGTYITSHGVWIAKGSDDLGGHRFVTYSYNALALYPSYGYNNAAIYFVTEETAGAGTEYPWLILHSGITTGLPVYGVRLGSTDHIGQYGTVAIGAVVKGGIITDLGSGTPQAQDAFLDDIAALADPGADRLLFWDDSAGEITWLTAGTGLTITGTTIAATGATLADGDYGDVTASSSGTVITIDANAVTFAKMQAVSANILLGNDAAGTAVEEIACTAFARSILDDADEATFKATTNLEIGTDVQAFDAFLDDIAALTDPGADRLMFWDDSAGEITWLTAGTGLTITGTTIAASSGTGDVVGPASSVASEIVLFDGTTGKLIKAATGTGIVSVTSGVYQTPANLSGQVTSSGLVTTLNLTGLTAADPALDDEVPIYDVGATANRKVTVQEILGLGPVAPGGRLTVTTGVPVAVSGADSTTLYYTPYLHNGMQLWDGTRWVTIAFAETAVTISSLTASSGYDVFGYLSGGALACEILIWATGSTRATGVSIQDGRYCKTGDKTRLYLGSFYSISTTETVEASHLECYVWNMYNRVRRRMYCQDSTSNWNYTTNTWRQVNAAAANKVEFFVGLVENEISAVAHHLTANAAFNYAATGIGHNATGSNNAQVFLGSCNASIATLAVAEYSATPTLGYNYLAWLETAKTGGTTTWFGTNSVNFDSHQSGMVAWGMF